MLRASTAVIVLTLALVACSGTGAEPSASETTAPPPTESTTTAVGQAEESTIPFGTYVKVDTREGLLASGIDESLIDEVLGSEDQVTYTIRIEDGIWSQFGAIGDSPAEPGDGGTFTYEDGLLLAISEAAGAAGTIQAWGWQLDSDQLTIQIDWDHSTAASEHQRESDSLVIDGVYEKTG